MTQSKTTARKTEKTKNAEKSEQSFVAKVKKILKSLGPGIITGASDDDPSGITTYSQAGARFGFGFLWTVFFTFPLMSAVQYICAKIGLVTKQGLAANLARYYPRWVAYLALALLVIANTINAGADLSALGAAINMILPGIPVEFALISCTLILLLVQAFCSFNTVNKVLKFLCISLFAYIATAFFVDVKADDVWKGIIPHSFSFDKKELEMLVAILGTTISPYLFFWQAIDEVEEEKALCRGTSAPASREKLKEAAIDVNLGMLFSSSVMFFIMLTTGATLFAAGKHEIGTAAQAAEALRPFAGDYAVLLFALGLIGTGFLALPVLTDSAAYGVAEIFAWKREIDKSASRAPEFYTIVVISTLIGLALNFLKINPMQALVWTAIINGLLAPPLMVLIMLMSNRKDIMGDKTNSFGTNIIGWLATAVMTLAAAALLLSWFPG